MGPLLETHVSEGLMRTQELFLDMLTGCRGSKHQSWCPIGQWLADTGPITRILKKTQTTNPCHLWGTVWHIQLMHAWFEQPLTFSGLYRHSPMFADRETDLQFLLLTAPNTTLDIQTERVYYGEELLVSFFLISWVLQNSEAHWELCLDGSNVLCTHNG